MTSRPSRHRVHQSRRAGRRFICRMFAINRSRTFGLKVHEPTLQLPALFQASTRRLRAFLSSAESGVFEPASGVFAFTGRQFAYRCQLFLKRFLLLNLAGASNGSNRFPLFLGRGLLFANAGDLSVQLLIAAFCRLGLAFDRQYTCRLLFNTALRAAPPLFLNILRNNSLSAELAPIQPPVRRAPASSAHVDFQISPTCGHRPCCLSEKNMDSRFAELLHGLQSMQAVNQNHLSLGFLGASGVSL